MGDQWKFRVGDQWRFRVGDHTPIRLVLADDRPLLRTGFRLVLDAEPDLQVVGEAADGREAVSLARRLQPDVILMNLTLGGVPSNTQNASKGRLLPRVDPIASTRQIVDVASGARVLILTSSDDDEYVVGALRAGASGFLGHDVAEGDLVAAIRTVASGGAVLTPSILRRLLDRFINALPDPHPDPPAALGSLTDREREVLMLVARGRSNAEIAAQLRVSDTTVKTHVGKVLTKLGLRDRVQAVVLAYESGLVRPGA